MEDEAEAAEPFGCIINPNDSAFERPGDMVARIRAYAERTGQNVPQTVGEINRTIMESLALECAKIGQGNIADAAAAARYNSYGRRRD